LPIIGIFVALKMSAFCSDQAILIYWKKSVEFILVVRNAFMVIDWFWDWFS